VVDDSARPIAQVPLTAMAAVLMFGLFLINSLN